MTISPEEFEKSLPQLSFGTIKQLIVAVQDLCQGRLHVDCVADLQRKQTKLWNELQRRGYNIKGPEFQNWFRKINHKRILF